MKEIILIPSYEPDKRLIELIKTIDRKRFDIVVVDDGSGPKYQDIFNKIKKKAYLISYQRNKGKGYALKKGIKYISDTYVDNYIVITMDSDGQHTISDAIKLSEYAKEHLNTLVLGMRRRNDKTPIRSKIGNWITKEIYYLVTDVNVYDTQSGLRAFSHELTDFLLEIKGNRFEYEMNCLLLCPKNGINMHEIEIETIYYDNNKGTHFNAFRDSYLIYKDIMMFSITSITSFLIDYLAFVIFTLFIPDILICNIMARMLSAGCNYTLNHDLVYKRYHTFYKSIFLYLGLALIILIVNTFLLSIFVNNLDINKYLAKILVEILLFIISLLISKISIFKNKN